jgi:hypothetical protein
MSTSLTTRCKSTFDSLRQSNRPVRRQKKNFFGADAAAPLEVIGGTTPEDVVGCVIDGSFKMACANSCEPLKGTPPPALLLMVALPTNAIFTQQVKRKKRSNQTDLTTLIADNVTESSGDLC